MPAYPIQNILFLDIETVPQYPSFAQMPEEWKKLWELKSSYLLKSRENETAESLYPRAGIYAEFGKIICICCGVIHGSGSERKLTIKSFYDDEENVLLGRFCEMLNSCGDRYLCAHNGKEFDFPFLCRRLIVNNIPIPSLLQLAGKKPWEVHHLDTLELWKFGDFKNYTSLDLLAQTLGLSTPKDDIDGSRVWSVYWNEKNFQRIVDYCRKDVITVAQVFLKMNSEPLIAETNILFK